MSVFQPAGGIKAPPPHLPYCHTYIHLLHLECARGNGPSIMFLKFHGNQIADICLGCYLLLDVEPLRVMRELCMTESGTP